MQLCAANAQLAAAVQLGYVDGPNLYSYVLT